MNHIGLFEGIGGFSIAAKQMGWETIAWCEINPFCQNVLKHHYPNATPHHDIKQTDFTIYRGECDIITGGFPCQPYSTAGKRLGKEDERHLWPEMLRAIREVAPRWVVGENVRGLLSWNGGLVFDEVQTDLEACGYEVWPFILPACGVNAPHRRDRIWFVAYSASCSTGSPGSSGELKSNRRNNNDEQSSWRTTPELDNGCGQFLQSTQNTNENGWRGDIGQEESEVGQLRNIGERDHEPIPTDNGEVGVATNTTNNRREDALENGELERGRSRFMDERNVWHSFPSQSPVCSGNDGFSLGLFDITFSKWRNESIKALGNAVVPQVVLQIFKAIEQCNQSTNQQ